MSVQIYALLRERQQSGTIVSFVASTNSRLGSVLLYVYTVYTEGISLASMKKHRLPFRLAVRRLKRRALFASVRVSLKPIDGTTGQWRYLGHYNTADRAVRSAARQRAQLEQPEDADQAFFKRMFGLVILKPLGPFREYLRLLALAGEHEILALKIRNNRLAASDLAKAVALSAVLAGIFAQLLEVDTGSINVGFGLLNSMLDGLFVMVVYLLGAALLHWPLRLAGGKARFRNTFAANTFVSAAVYPLVVLMVGVATYFGMDEAEAWRSAQVGPGGMSLLVLAPTHGISWGRAFVALFLTLPFVLMAVALVVLAVFATVA